MMVFVVSDRGSSAIAASRDEDSIEWRKNYMAASRTSMKTCTKKVPRNVGDDAQPLGLFLGSVALVRIRLDVIR